MAGRGRPKAVIAVSDEDRVVLERWSKRPKSPMSVAQRARIVLLAADGLNNNVVAERVGVNQNPRRRPTPTRATFSAPC